jgi:hypothetical protein
MVVMDLGNGFKFKSEFTLFNFIFLPMLLFEHSTGNSINGIVNSCHSLLN